MGRHRLGHHQRTAGLGVWCANTSVEKRDLVKAWKRSFPYDVAILARFADDVASLIRAWSGNVFAGRVVVTVPPRGASLFGESAEWPYAAEILAERVAGHLGFPFVPTLRRTDTKRLHGPWHSLKHSAYLADVPDPKPCMVLVVDDLITSGATMKLSLAAIRKAGIPAFGFSFSGHGRGN